MKVTIAKMTIAAIAAVSVAALLAAAPAKAQLQYMDYTGKNKGKVEVLDPNPQPGQQGYVPLQSESRAKPGKAPEHTYGFGSMDEGGSKNEPYSGFGMQTSTVTPLEDCLKQLPPDEAAEVKLQYIQPYRECRMRLANKAAEARHLEVTRKEDEAVPETPRNYIRVQKDPSEGASGGARGGKGASDGDFYGINPDGARPSYNR